jgi:hypothetical protein
MVTNDVAVEIFLAGADTAGSISEPSRKAQAAAAWGDFQGSSCPDAFDAVAEAYPDTAYAALGISMADRLRAGQAPVVDGTRLIFNLAPPLTCFPVSTETSNAPCV